MRPFGRAFSNAALSAAGETFADGGGRFSCAAEMIVTEEAPGLAAGPVCTSIENICGAVPSGFVGALAAV
jgi:L-serine deaminase